LKLSVGLSRIDQELHERERQFPLFLLRNRQRGEIQERQIELQMGRLRGLLHGLPPEEMTSAKPYRNPQEAARW
jgi:hypothetical protein